MSTTIHKMLGAPTGNPEAAIKVNKICRPFYLVRFMVKLVAYPIIGSLVYLESVENFDYELTVISNTSVAVYKL